MIQEMDYNSVIDVYLQQPGISDQPAWTMIMCFGTDPYQLSIT